MRAILFAAAFAALSATAADAAPVLMISIDGLRPLDIIDAQARGLKVPNLTAIMKHGAYATGVRNVLPTVTYPNHTTLITGVAPAIHGISNNVTFDPLQKNMEGWYWYSSDIRVPTLWDAVHANHQVVASVSWPVSVGNPSIDYVIPEYWRARTADDLKLLRALSTPGLIPVLEKASGTLLAATYDETPEADDARARLTASLITLEHPQFTTLHIISLDGFQHEFGPGTPEAHATLEAIDTTVGMLVESARHAEPDVVIVIVSDHGFAAIEHDVNLAIPFLEARLATVDLKTHKVTDWQAEPWSAGGSVAVVLKNPNDEAVKAKVRALLAKLAADPANGIDRVIEKPEIEKRGGASEASFWIDLKLGYEMGRSFIGPLVTAGSIKGTHGYFPDHKEMRATFMIDGPSVTKHGSLGDIDMRDIAPTVAKVLGVGLPSATGKPLF
ncbi:MAG TPA: ectonucleotide pyrophosphatase/phosphodiesterase [Rhizomicrobium sp.]|jgi:predicted AlkP superfamily pyrophosphatase or phosphodiesterase